MSSSCCRVVGFLTKKSLSILAFTMFTREKCPIESLYKRSYYPSPRKQTNKYFFLSLVTALFRLHMLFKREKNCQKCSISQMQIFRLRRAFTLHNPVSLGSRLPCLQNRRKLGVKVIDPDLRLRGRQQRRHLHGLLRLHQQQQPQPVHLSRTQQLPDGHDCDTSDSVQTWNLQLRLQHRVSQVKSLYVPY